MYVDVISFSQILINLDLTLVLIPLGCFISGLPTNDDKFVLKGIIPGSGN